MNDVGIFQMARKIEQIGALSPRSRADLVIEQAARLVELARKTHLSGPASPAFVRRALEARAARRRFFDGDLFSDPAWDILLELYALGGEQRRTSISKLSIAAAIPPTTALRWLEKLHKEGLIEREDDPLDARRVWVTLSDQGLAAMTAYLVELADGAMPI